MLTLTFNIKPFISHMFDTMHSAIYVVDCLSIVQCTKYTPLIVVMTLSW